MESKNKIKIFLLMPLIIFSFGAISCAEANRSADILDIGIRWMDVEQNITQAHLARTSEGVVQTEGIPESVIQYLDKFYESVRSFIDSESYRTYRLISHDSGITANDLVKIDDLGRLVLSLRQAMLDGDWERTMLAASGVSGSVIYYMARGQSADRVLARTYFQLLLAFCAIILFAGFLVWLFHERMARSQKHAEEGSAFSRAMLTAQEQERGRIYKELHDTVVQDLCYLSAGMEKIGLTDEGAERRSLCAEALAIQAGVIGRMRDICGNLAPPEFGMRSLPDMLRQLCLDFGHRTGISCRMVTEENANLHFPEGEQNLHIFRIVQEALTNVEKHADAGEAAVELQCENDGSFSVTVSDNGTGFDPGGAKSAPSGGGIHLGVRGMKERAILLGGNLAITSQRGKGTQVSLSVPRSHNTQTDLTVLTADVLLIDDHPLTIKGIASSLKETGRFPVLAQANSLGEAQDFVKKADKLPLLIVLDVQLAEKNGLDFLPFLQDFCRKKKSPMPPVLIYSAFEDRFRIKLALKFGASGYAIKNGNMTEFLNAVDTVLRGEVHIPNGTPCGYDDLSKRELEVLVLARQGKTYEQIACIMYVSKRTVETHINNIYLKTGTSKRSELTDL